VIVDEDGGHRRVVGGGRFAAFSDDGSTVYFADARPGFSSMPWSGGRARPVTPASACARFSLSPDHVHMTYDRGCDPKYGSEFVLSRLDGSDQHTLDDGDGGSTWSPDGRWLAWVGCRGLAGCPLTLVRMFDTLTGSVRQVSNGRLYGWSPNGDWLVVSDEEGGRDDVHHLVIQHADGSGRRTLPVTDPGGVSWAPDSSRLVAGEGSRLVVVDIAAGRSRVLADTHDDQGVGYLEWSPDGSTIAFMEPPQSPPPFDALQLVGISPDGTNRRVMFGPGNVALHEPAAWAPDSQAIAVEGDVDDADQLFIVSIATGVATRVSVNGQHAGATTALMLGGWGLVPPAGPAARPAGARAAVSVPPAPATSTSSSSSSSTTSTTAPRTEVAGPRRRHASGAGPVAALALAVVVVAGVSAGVGARLRHGRVSRTHRRRATGASGP
jgi:Tol biopolymer transport system component